MRAAPGDDAEPDFDAELRPSKSSRKRAAHAAQKLGEELTRLKLAELEALNLPEELHGAILEAQRISKSRGGFARQRQYIGKLMRSIDLAPIEAAIELRQKRGSPSRAELAARSIRAADEGDDP
jgi:ribosome-associated protein